jgi:hypothetical protein
VLAESFLAGPDADCDWAGGYSRHKGLLTTRAFFGQHALLVEVEGRLGGQGQRIRVTADEC